MKKYPAIFIIVFISFGSWYFMVSDAKEQSVVASNNRFRYPINIQGEWIKAEEAENYMSWVTPKVSSENVNHLKKGAKLAIAVLDNFENLPISDWLARYSGEDPYFLIDKKPIQFQDFIGERYLYSHSSINLTPSRINIYLQAPNLILGFAVFFEETKEDDRNYEKELPDLIEKFLSLNFFNKQTQSFLKTLIAYAAPIPVSAPWNGGYRWIAGSGCYGGGSYYGDPPGHTGNDFYAIDFNGVFDENCLQIENDDGKAIRAVNSGSIAFIGQNPLSGYGYFVLLDHGSGITSRYAHLKYDPIILPGIQVGQQISKGQIIGYNGMTGDATGNHLHFVLYQNSSSVPPDPMDDQSLCDTCEGTLVLSKNYFVVYVSGTITQDTTWTAGNVYVIQSSVTVNPGVTLTIEPGVVVKFMPSTFYSDSYMEVYGMLNAQGTSANKIYFTSLKDDTVGGDTNGDGSATTPAPDDYHGIRFQQGSTGNFAHSVLRYGGNYYWYGYGMINNFGGNVSVIDSQITDSGYFGIFIYTTQSIGQLTINSSLISNNVRDGINILSLATTSVSIANSNFSGNGSFGLGASTGGGGFLTLALTFNTFSNNKAGDASINGDVNFINSDNTTSGTAKQGFYISGTSPTDQVWNPGVPFVIYVFTVNQDRTLTIQPGTIVKIIPSSLYSDAFIDVSGTLNAQGTPDKKIYFTSFTDDSVGGDTNGDGSATTPAPEDYHGIRFQQDSTGNFAHSVLRYGGNYYLNGYGMINNFGGNVSVINSQITDSGYFGIFIYTTQSIGQLTINSSLISNNVRDGINILSLATTSVSIANSNFSGNGSFGLGASTGGGGFLTLALTFNTFSNNSSGDAYLSYGSIDFINSGNTTSGVTAQGFFISGISPTNQIWNPGVPFIPSYFAVASGKSLTIQPGAIVKFPASGIINILGSLNAQTTPTNKIYFTSLKDDSVGGDTNGDGNATAPAPGDYHGIYFGTNSTGLFNNVVLRYGGAYWQPADGMIRNFGGNVNIDNTIISSNQYGIYQISGTTTVSRSSIYRNNAYGIYNSSSNSVVAQNNWWGHRTGPYHPTLNPGGLGNPVSDNVNFIPWLKQEPPSGGRF